MGARIRWLLLSAMVVVVLGVVLFLPRLATQVGSATIGNNIISRELDIEMGHAARPRHLMPLSSGVVYAALDASGELGRRAQAAGRGPAKAAPLLPTAGTLGCQNTYGDGKNIRVNQDCTLRRQAEEVIAVNPTDPMNLIAGQNDSRIGFNHCGYDWSADGGRTWGDLVPPFWQFTMLDGHTADACSDPTASFDHLGNAYIAGILFQINSPASAIVVAKSNAYIKGRFYHSPANIPFQTYSTSPLGVVANDNDANIFHDKEFLVADANQSSPKAGNVYMTWTRFQDATGYGVDSNSPIYFSQSTDGGESWSGGTLISGENPALCTAYSASASANACDQDQGSQPVVGPDGGVYVVFSNQNTPVLGEDQVLFVSCPGGADCTVPGNWTDPVKVGDLITKLPLGPDATTGCPAGRQCLPPNGYRAPLAVWSSLSVDRYGRLYVAWADFRNGGGTCDWNGGAAGQAAIATPPCNNDVFYAYSMDGGATWSGAINVTPESRFGPTAQWQPWSAVGPEGLRLWIGFYDRSYGNCELSGCNDITLARVSSPASGSPTIIYKRLTTSSMPNLVVANNPLEAGFLGDYMWVTTDAQGRPYVVWADTRGRDGAVEEDVYFRPPGT